MDFITKCDFCPKSFYNERDFLSHVAERHELKPAICILCYKRFSHRTNRDFFENHMRECKYDNWIINNNICVGILFLPLSKNNEITSHWLLINGEKIFLDFYYGHYTKVSIFWPFIHYSSIHVLNMIKWCNDSKCTYCHNIFKNHFTDGDILDELIQEM